MKVNYSEIDTYDKLVNKISQINDYMLLLGNGMISKIMLKNDSGKEFDWLDNTELFLIDTEGTYTEFLVREFFKQSYAEMVIPSYIRAIIMGGTYSKITKQYEKGKIPDNLNLYDMKIEELHCYNLEDISIAKSCSIKDIYIEDDSNYVVLPNTLRNVKVHVKSNVRTCLGAKINYKGNQVWFERSDMLMMGVTDMKNDSVLSIDRIVLNIDEHQDVIDYISSESMKLFKRKNITIIEGE